VKKKEYEQNMHLVKYLYTTSCYSNCYDIYLHGKGILCQVKKKMPGGHRLVSCTMCGDMSISGNLSRHMQRKHHLNTNGTPVSSATTSSGSSRDQSPALQPRRALIGVQESLPAVMLNNVVRDAVSCMLKRTESINMISPQQYLMTRFPSIPVEMID